MRFSYGQFEMVDLVRDTQGESQIVVSTRTACAQRDHSHGIVKPQSLCSLICVNKVRVAVTLNQDANIGHGMSGLKTKLREMTLVDRS